MTDEFSEALEKGNIDLSEAKIVVQRRLEAAKVLFVEYDNPCTEGDRAQQIVIELNLLGYVIRPDNGVWKLMNRRSHQFID